MINITLIHVGDFREQYFRDAQNEYEKRLEAFCHFRSVCVREENTGASPAETEKALRKEGARIAGLIPKKAYVYALCVEGTQCSSEEFASELDRIRETYGDIVFIIGSSHGLCEEVKGSASKKLSFSKMTLPHRLMRIVLTEQIYRAFTIGANLKYHK